MKSSSEKAKKTAKAKSGARKVAPKPAAKPSKPTSKLSKPAVKPSAGKTTKPAAKPAPKPAAKVAVKKGAKPAPKSAGKPATRSKASKPAVKPVAPAKAVALKTAARAKAVPAKNRPVPLGTTKPPSKAAVPVNVKTPSKPVPAPVPVAAPIPAVTLPGAVAQRAGRPSSRLASLTVPSMAQSVASTAAKASYSQLPTAPLIVPPVPSSARKDPKLANNWKTKSAEQLTDSELLAMPDTEYMNEKQMAAFRLKLVALKQGILNSAGETTEHLREDTVVVPDPADRATIEEEHALELRTRDRERKLLKKIEQSIDRIDAGDYGYCDETGEPIGVGRLLARPTATLSLEAQQRRELKQKMFGD